MNPTIYVITYHEFNHGPLRPNWEQYPLDSRFLQGSGNYVYYLIDKQVPEILKDKPTLLEYQIDPQLHKAGGKFLGEWSFLLAEAKHAFASYPLFMISSRFYEKNQWLYRDLNTEWETLFHFFDAFGYGYLPSYNRPLRWIDMSWQKAIEKEVWKHKFFPFTAQTYQLVKEVFGITIPEDYRFTADLFCNYIGFRNREELLAYVNFYRPILDYFFDENYQLKRSMQPYVRAIGSFRNEKAFTFVLELICHLFFFAKKQKYFALHYDGYYSIDESEKQLKKLKHFPLPISLKMDRHLRWTWHHWNTEGFLSPLRTKWKALKS